MKLLYACAACGAGVLRKPSEATGRVFCSRACVHDALRGVPQCRPGQRGPDHPGWKGGIKLKDGYRFIWRPDHPNADPHTGYVPEHRLVMSEVLGRPLLPDESVHHRSRDRLDNRPENLVILDAAGHARAHRATEPRGWARWGRGCAECGTTERRHFGKGLCRRCYQRAYVRGRRAAGYIAPGRRKEGEGTHV